VNAPRVRELLGLPQADLGEIDAGDPPAVLGQPDRIAALAAGEIERTTGCESVYLLNQG
jgi:hypothetical protein